MTPPDPHHVEGAGPDAGDLAAGEPGAWLDAVQAALAGDADADVPCGTCTACCTSAQFVHIAPDETDTLAHIPRALRFPAPGLPAGHVLLGYDERGHCPMLVEGACTIYAHRPRTCRTYDCRVFPATGIAPEETKVEIVRQAERWRFDPETGDARGRLAAVRAAAARLRDDADALLEQGAPLPGNPTQLAVLAIEIHRLFLGADPAGTPATPATAAVAAEIRSVVERRRRNQA